MAVIMRDPWTLTPGIMPEADEFPNMGAREASCDGDLIPDQVQTDPDEIARAIQWRKTLNDAQTVLHYRNRNNL